MTRWIWGLLVLLVLLAGCASQPTPVAVQPTGTPTSTISPTPSTTGFVSPGRGELLAQEPRPTVTPRPHTAVSPVPHRSPPTAVRAWPRVAMLDAQHIWFVKPSSDQHPRAGPFSLFVTTDGGQTWNERMTTDAAVEQLQVVSPLDGFAVMHDMVHTTHDGGATWQPMRLATTSPIVYFYFHTPEEGFVIPEPADRRIPSWTVFRTNDRGMSWTEVTIPSPCQQGNAGSRFAFYGLLTGWVVCIGQSAGFSQGRAWYITTDGGATWAYRSPQPPQDEACQVPEAEQPIRCRIFHMQSGRLRDVIMLDAQHGWFVHHTYETGGLQMTSDGGVTWHYVDIPSQEHATHDPHPAVDFASRTEGVVVVVDGWLSTEGVEHILYRTTDGGQSWEQIYP